MLARIRCHAGLYDGPQEGRLIASGSPTSPSQQAIRTSVTPRLAISAITMHHDRTTDVADEGNGMDIDL